MTIVGMAVPLLFYEIPGNKGARPLAALADLGGKTLGINTYKNL